MKREPIEPSPVDQSQFSDMIETAYQSGNTDALLGLREEMRAALSAARLASLGLASEIRLRTILASTCLVMLDRSAARDALSPFLSVGGAGIPTLRNDVIAAAQLSVGPLELGQCLSVAADLFHRFDDQVAAAKASTRADAFFEEVEPRSSDDELLLACARIQNGLWRVRIGAKSKHPDLLDRDLQGLIQEIHALYPRFPGHAWLGRVDLLLALALSIRAPLEWRSGHLDTARAHCYRAFFILGRNRASDSVRRGYLFYTTARIEGSESVDKLFHMATQLARDAVDTFDAICAAHGDHPIRLRCSVVLAQCLKKAGQLDACRRLLAQLEKDVANTPSLEPHHRNIIQGHVWLTRLWLLADEASESEEARREGRDLAKAILNLDPIPRGLKAEGHLHLGLAHIRGARLDEVDSGRVELRAGRDIAFALGRTKIEAACLLGLCESYRESDRLLSLRYLEKARSRIAAARSTFLEEWAAELAVMMKGPVAIDLGRPLRQVLDDVRTRCVDYHVALAPSPDEACKTLDINRSSLYRLRGGGRG